MKDVMPIQWRQRAATEESDADCRYHSILFGPAIIQLRDNWIYGKAKL